MKDKPPGVNKATWGQIQRIDAFISSLHVDAVLHRRAIDELTEGVGELRLAVWGLMERVERLENRCACDDAEMRKTVVGTIQGLDGEWTVTPPPEFEA